MICRSIERGGGQRAGVARNEDDVVVIDGAIDGAGAAEVPHRRQVIAQPGVEELAPFGDGQDAGQSNTVDALHVDVSDGVARAAGVVGDVAGI